MPPTLSPLRQGRGESDGRVKAVFLVELIRELGKTGLPMSNNSFDCPEGPAARALNQGGCKTKKAHPVSQDELDIVR